MNNKQKSWSRTLLTAYTYLEKISNSIDSLIKDCAVNSFYSHGYGWEANSILTVSNRIIELSDKKVKYINLKVIIEKALKNMPTKLSKIAILRYVHELSHNEIIKLLNLNVRTYYRLLTKMPDVFAYELFSLGYSTNKLEADFSEDKFISSIYKVFDDSDDVNNKTEVFAKDVMIQNYIREIRACC